MEFSPQDREELVPILKALKEKGVEPTPELIAKANFKYFFTRVLKFQWAPHFAEWQWLIENPKKRFLLECARGHGKTIFLTGYCLWLIYRGFPVDILFMSHSEEQVRNNVMNKIDEIINTNEHLAHLRPTSKEMWSSQLKRFDNGSQIRGESFGSSIRGAHPDYVFVDDPLKDKGGMTPEEQHRYYMTAISGTCKRDTVLGTIGTPLDLGDLLEQLESNPAYEFRSYPAIKADGEPLFPFLFTKEDLAKKELEVGTFAFSREFLLQRIDSKNQMFKDHFRAINNGEFPDFALIRTMVDPAISEKESACDSAIVTGGIDARNHKWELNTQLVQSDDPTKIIECILVEARKHCKHHDYAIVIESEVFQKVLAFDLRQKLLEQHLDVRVIEVTHSGNQGKHQRIAGLQPSWEARAIHLLPESPLISQFRYYRPNAKGMKLDGLDAFSWIRHEDVAVPVTESVVVDDGVPPEAWD